MMQSSRRKILLISNTEWYLYNFRRTLARDLQGQGFEVVMVSPPGPYAEKLQALGFRWVSWPVGRKTLTPWGELAALLRLYRIYRQEQPDIVHHHTIKPCLYGSLAAGWLPRKQHKPGIVNSITGRGYLFIATDLLARTLRRLVEPIYRLAFRPENCYAIFENPTDQAFFVDHRLIPAQRTRLVESVGVDLQTFTPGPEPAGDPVVLLAARMLWDKGVGVLVDAARLLRARAVPVRVALAGLPDPGNPSSIPEETLLGWQAEGLVEWWGFQQDMNAAYNQSHVVTLPSMYGEGVPTVLIEGGACARPLVTTRMPGCQDVVEDGVNGFLVPPNDAQALANAIETLALDPDLRQKMGAAARSTVIERFTTTVVNAATLDVYAQAGRWHNFK